MFWYVSDWWSSMADTGNETTNWPAYRRLSCTVGQLFCKPLVCLFVRRMHKPAKWLEFNIPVCLCLQPWSLLLEMPGKLIFFRTQVCIYERSASLSRQCIECTGVRSSGGAHFFINSSTKTNEYAKIQWWGLLLQIPMLGHKDEKSPIIP
jgi:hypothetical protein